MSWTFQPLLIASQEAPGVQLLAGTISASSSIPNVPFIRRTREVAGSFGATSSIPNVSYIRRIRRIIGVPIQGVSGVSANLIIYIPPVLLSGAIGSFVLTEGVAKRLRRLLGISEAFSSAVGVLRAGKRLVGSSAAVSSIGGTLKVTKKLASATGTASYVNESFEGTGYENAWNEYEGAGQLIDPDNSDVTPPSGGGSQVLKMVSTASGGTGVACYIYRDTGTERADTWTTLYFRVGSLTDICQIPAILMAWDASWNNTLTFRLSRSGSTYTLRLDLYYNGAFHTDADTATITPGEWHKIDLKYNKTGSAWEWRVDGNVEGSGSGTLSGGIQHLQIDATCWSAGMNATTYWDRIWIDDSEYGYGAGVSAVSSVTGSLKRIKSLSGSISGVSSISGLLKKTARLFGTIDSVSSVIGDLGISAGAKALAGTVDAVSSVTGSLKVVKKFFGTSTATSSVSGVLKVVKKLWAKKPDLINEGFEAPGYDMGPTFWTETINSGCTLDPDYGGEAAPFGRYCLRAVKASGVNWVELKRTFPSQQNVLFKECRFKVKSFTGSVTDSIQIFRTDDASWNQCGSVMFNKSGASEYKLYIVYWTGGASQSRFQTSPTTVNLDQWYHLNVRVDVNVGLVEWWLDDVLQGSYTLTAPWNGAARDVRVGATSGASAVEAEALFDRIRVSTQGWTAGVEASSSVYGNLKRVRPLSGSISGVSGASGVLERTRKLVGTCSAISGISGALEVAGQATLVGSFASTSGITGNLKVFKKFFGTSTPVASFVGQLRRTREVAGACASILSTTGVARRLRKIGGTVSAVSTISGVLERTRKLAGTCSAASGISGTLEVAGQATLVGSFASTSGITGNLKVFKKFFGTSTPVASFVGQLRRTREVAGVISSASSITGSAKRIKRILGTSASLSSVSGKIENTRRLFGVVSAVSSVTGALATQGKVDLYGTISAVSSVTGLLRVRKEVAGAVGVVSSCAGILKVQRELASSIASQSVITGRPEVSRKLVGAVGAVSSITGFAKIGKEFVGAVSGVSLITGRPEISRKLVGAVNAVSSISGVWHSTKEFKGVIAAQTVVSGVLRKFFPLSGSIASVSSVIGYLKRLREIAGSISGVVDINGYLVSGQEVRLRGPISAVSTVSGKFNVDYSLFGVINAVSSVVGTTKLLEEIAGRIDAISVISGTPRVTRPLAGAFSASSSIVGYIQHVFRYVLKVFIRKVTRIFNRVETKKILDRKEKKRIFIGGPYGD